MLAGRQLGELQVTGNTQTTNYFLSDGLGSVLGVFSNTANTASLLASHLYYPYGASRYGSGSVSPYTTKGFTGQYNDPTSGLDYYGARYYDPVVGLFVSADKKLRDVQGANPYEYVGQNPETNTDPTGEMYAPPAGPGSPPQENPPPSPPQNPSQTTKILPRTNTGDSGLTQLKNELLGMRTLYAYARLIMDLTYGNAANTGRDVATLLSLLNLPILDDTSVVTAFTGLIDQNQGPAYQVIRQFVGDKAINRILGITNDLFEGISILYYIIDAIQNSNNPKEVIADALGTTAYILDLLRKPISKKLGIESETLDQVIIFLGWMAAILQFSNMVQPPSSQGNSDHRDWRRGFGGGGFPPPTPPISFVPAAAAQPNPQELPGSYTPYPDGWG
jgi:RHS repeat-associated protein